MADIAFLLIVYFLVTTVFSATKGMDLDLPAEEPPETPPAIEPAIYVEVLPDGAIRVDGQPMELDRLLAYVVPRIRINRAKPVILHPHPETPYRSMIRVYDELMRSGERTGVPIRNVTVPTQREIDEYVKVLGQNPFDLGNR
jgi:biopolymer transport protein ExbD